MTVSDGRERVPVNDLRRAAWSQRAELDVLLERFLESGRYVLGPQHADFEHEFAAYVGTRDCVGVASGTDALELALRAVGCVPGDAILTAANCGGYASIAARRAGLRVRYADVDSETLSLSAATVGSALDADVRAVVVTHLYGLLAHVEEIEALCRERGIAVVEDAAQAVGARRGGRRAGSFGDAAAFSFYPTKNLGALGDGGAVCTSREDIAESVRSLRQYGWVSKYEVARGGGWNSRLDELQSAVLRARLPLIDEGNRRRRQIVARYAASLRADAGRFVAVDGEDYVAHLAVALVEDRDRVRAVFETAGIGTDVHYPVPDHRQPAWAADYVGVTLPVTEHGAEHVLTLPCFPELRDDEAERVCEVLRGL
jgi:dTDP-4-amino-4,6-dideoxygalactose transaminase